MRTNFYGKSSASTESSFVARRYGDGKRDFSLREAVLFMASKLTEMKELGFTTRELAAALAEQGNHHQGPDPEPLPV